MSYIDVKNKKGTSHNIPPSDYTSWLAFWEKKKGTKATICEAMFCTKKPDVGGHVIKSGEGGKEYILPLCFSHNNKSEDEVFSAWENALFPIH